MPLRLSSIMAMGLVSAALALSGTTLRSVAAPAVEEVETPAPSVEQSQPQKLFDNGNVYAVENRPSRTTAFRVNVPVRIATISTYHWNYGRGSPAGTIALRSSSGEVFGPWEAIGRPGQGGVPSAYWVVEVDVVLPPGTYTVIDSNPSTWSQNSATRGSGIAVVMGYVE